MRILHVNDYAIAGGCEAVVEQTVQLLREAGHDVDLFVASKRPKRPANPFAYIDSLEQRGELAERIESFKPEIVHLHNFYHLLSPGILGTLRRWRNRSGGKVIMTAHDGHLACPNSGMNYVRFGRLRRANLKRLHHLGYTLGHRWDERTVFHSMLKVAQHEWNYRLLRRHRVLDLVLCPSKFLRDILAQTGVPTQHLPLPGPNPPSHLADGPRRSPKRLRIVFAGRLAREKGLASFLHDLPLPFPGQIVIVGDGPQYRELLGICLSRGIDRMVRFPGHLEHHEVMLEIANAHVLVLPSLCYENAPLVLLEALAVGTNILTSNFGGMAEIVADAGVGFTYDPEDADSLVHVVREVIAGHHAGTLNGFDVADYLKEHRASTYRKRLVEIYQQFR